MGSPTKTNSPLLHRYFLWSYIIGLSLVAGIILLNYGIISRYLTPDPNNPLNARSYVSRMVNIAGRCATDAQAIEIAVWKLSAASTAEEQQQHIQNIQYSLATLEKGYVGLQKGDPDFNLDVQYNTEEIQAIFRVANQHFSRLTNLAHELIEAPQLDSSLLAQARQTISKEVPLFVSYMQDIAFKYDEQAAQVVAYWGRVALGLTIVSIVLLLLIGLLVFRPVTRTIQQYFEKLQIQKQALESANRELRLNEDRMRRQAHRLHELNQELLKAQEELLHANQEKEMLLALLTKNLRVPLRTMRNITHLLTHFVDKLSKEEIRQSAQDLEYAINQIDVIAENIFVWLAIQKDELPLHLSSITLNYDKVQQLIEEIQSSLDTNKVSLQTSITDEIQIYADAQLLRLLLLNIIYFHISESKQGNGITLAIAAVNESKCVLRIEVPASVAAIKLPGYEGPVRSHLAASLRETFSLIYKDILKKQAGTLKVEKSEHPQSIIYEIQLPTQKSAYSAK